MPGETLNLSSKTESSVIDPPSKSAGTLRAHRILFVIDSWFPGMGGAEKQAVKLAKALRAKGIEVEFIAPHLNTDQPITQMYEGFQVTKISYPKIKLLGAAILNARFAWYLFSQRHKFSSAHFHVTQTLAGTAGFIRPFTGLPCVAKISGFYEFEHGVLARHKPLNPILRLIRLGLRNIDYVQTISEQTRAKLVDAGFRSEQIKFVPNGIDCDTTPRERQYSKDKVFSVGYCGRMAPVKGVDVLLRGFAQWLKSNPDRRVKLTIAGGGNDAQFAESVALANQLGLGQNVDFLGVINDVPGFLATQDLYVQPSYAEGLPNSVMEAMNAALPVIATDIGGNHDLITHEHNGFLFPAGDVDALEALLERAYSQYDDVLPMGQISRQLLSDSYSFDSVTEQLLDLYDLKS